MDTSKVRGWIQLCSDVNWEDYGGMWAKRAKDGSWYVLRWTNLYDAMGEKDCKRDGHPQFECDVKRVDLDAIGPEGIAQALNSCGWKQTEEGIICPHSGDIVATPEHAPLCIVECCIGYGFGAPLESFSGDHYPLRIRAQARRYALQCMRDENLLEERLERPVNAIMTSAEDYGTGHFGFGGRK